MNVNNPTDNSIRNDVYDKVITIDDYHLKAFKDSKENKTENSLNSFEKKMNVINKHPKPNNRGVNIAALKLGEIYTQEIETVNFLKMQNGNLLDLYA